MQAKKEEKMLAKKSKSQPNLSNKPVKGEEKSLTKAKSESKLSTKKST